LHADVQHALRGRRSNIAPWQVPAGWLRLIGRDAEVSAIGQVLDEGGADGRGW
jgi:hypothetical protein